MPGYFTGSSLDPATQALIARLGRASSSPPPVANGGYITAQNSVQSAVGTSRVPYYIATAATDIRLVYTNWFVDGTFMDIDNTANLVLNASIEIAGVIYRVNFDGLITATISPGGVVMSDALPLEIPAGTLIYVRTFTNGTQWYPNRYAQYAGGGGFTVTTDLTAPGSGAIADNTALTKMLAPSAIVGNPTTNSAQPPAVLIVGDSIAYGQADGVQPGVGINTNNLRLGGGGYIVRALQLAGVASINLGNPGDAAFNFITYAGHVRRLAFADNCTTAICEYGRNDISAGRTLQQVQAALISEWQMLSFQRGMKVIQTTITPKTTSTDSWLTTANQTLETTSAVRTQLNDWIRDGAPLTSLTDFTPLATGSLSGVRMGAAGHPLSAFYEIADLAETSRNSGVWKPAANIRTVADGAMTIGTTTLTSATANFVAGDVGRNVSVAGAGTAGAALLGTIKTVASSSSVTITAAAIATVSAVALTVYDGYTQDGTHPQSYSAAFLAAGVDVTKLV